jgi:hypothetical protein
MLAADVVRVALFLVLLPEVIAQTTHVVSPLNSSLPSSLRMFSAGECGGGGELLLAADRIRGSQ